MPQLHLFNPDNDLALASGLSHYTPPLKALQLRRAGAMLPLWYGSEGDRIVCQGVNDEWFCRITETFGIQDIDIYDHAPHPELQPAPWGWSAAARTLFIDSGVPTELLPSDEAISRIRQLSHRRTAKLLAHKLLDDKEFRELIQHSGRIPAAEAIEITDISQLPGAMDKIGGAAILKAPWSSSGRGVFRTAAMSAQRIAQIAEQTIRAQDSVMIEPEYANISNFALLFRIDGGISQLWGYSSFATAPNGQYLSNRLLNTMSHQALLSSITGVDVESLGNIIAAKLTEIIGTDYTGYLGVDMLVGTDAIGRPILDPFVEVNLRCTMGVVAQHLATRFVDTESLLSHQCTFAVLPSAGTVSRDAIIRNGCLVQGTVNLVPPDSNFSFFLSATKQD